MLDANNNQGTYAYMESRNSVAIVVLNDKNELYLHQAFRYPTKTWGWEIPGGGGDNEDLLVASKRELEEETGILAKSWQILGTTIVCNGLMTEKQTTCLAYNISFDGSKESNTSEVFNEHKFVSFEKAASMIVRGEINDNQTITAIYLTEYASENSLIAKTIRFAVRTLAVIPSIIYGLFGLGFFIKFVGVQMDNVFMGGQLKWGQPNILWASLTMALLTLPVVIVSVEEALKTPAGQAVVSFLIGAVVPVVEDKIPEKYRSLANEAGQEARVQGECVLAEMFIDQLGKPAMQAAINGIQGSLDKVIESETMTEVRAELPATKASPNLSEVDVDASKEALKTRNRKD